MQDLNTGIKSSLDTITYYRLGHDLKSTSTSDHMTILFTKKKNTLKGF